MLIPEIDPIALQIGPIAIRWYGLTWLAAFSTIYFLIIRYQKDLNNEQVTIDYACCIYATAPFIHEDYINQGLKILVEKKTKFAFSITTFPFSVQRALKLNQVNKIEPMWPEYILERSQDLEEAFHDAGQFYWGSAEAFLNEDDMYFNNSSPVLMPRFLTQDIDTQEDWKQAELLFNALKITNDYD